MPFEDTTAIVTGGAQGLGLAIAEALAARGTKVAIFDLATELIDAEVARLREQGEHRQRLHRRRLRPRRGQGRGRAGARRPRAGPDLGQQRRHRAIRQVHRDHRRAVGSGDGDQPARAVHLHPGGAAGHGRPPNGAGSSTFRPPAPRADSPGWRPTSARKPASSASPRVLALELGPKGITVNTIPPGMVVTPMLEKAIEEGRFTASLEHFAKITPVRRAGRPEDIANAAIFLCQDESSYVTGQVIGVNGGRRT